MKNNGLFIGAGLVILGIFLYLGVTHFKDADRIVSVRGLSEREVEADRVLWPVVYSIGSNDFYSINNSIDNNNKTILEFITSAGIPSEDIIVNSFSVEDLNADRYSENKLPYRYLATQVITVNTDKVSEVIKLQQTQNSLLKHGIALATNSYQYGTEFIFTKLNDIKPEMIEQATKAARESAEKFAQDSGSDVGNIRTATQGQFSIEDRDSYTPQIKKVRVVTYLSYELN